MAGIFVVTVFPFKHAADLRKLTGTSGVAILGFEHIVGLDLWGGGETEHPRKSKMSFICACLHICLHACLHVNLHII